MQRDIINTEENRKLLYKHLVKYAESQNKPETEELAKTLIRKNKDNLFGENGLSQWLGSKSIEYFCMYYLQDTFVPKPNNKARKLADVHFEVWQELEKMFIADEYDKLELIMPRGCAKTTVCDYALSVWLHCYRKSIYTVVCGKTEQDATEFIAETRQAFEENPYIINTFGKLIDTKNYTVNKLELELSNKTKVQALSSTSSPRGKKYNGNRITVCIGDDYQGKSDVITEESRNKKYNMWIEDTEEAGDEAVYRIDKNENKVKIKSATKFIALGTILHRDCFMSRLLKNKDYKHILKRVVEFDVDEYFSQNKQWQLFKKILLDDKNPDSKLEAEKYYYDHISDMRFSTIWDDKYDCLSLAVKYFTKTTAFKQELMNDASKIGEKWFKSNRIQKPEEIEDHTFIKTMLCCDPASTTTNKSDYTALGVGSLADNDFKYMRKGIIEKLDFNSYCNKVIELLKQFEDITHVYVEKNTYQGADVLKMKELIDKTPELTSRNIEFINEMQRKNKDEKISTIIDDVNNGRIIFNADDKEFIEQVMQFAGQNYSEHDDAADIVSEFSNRIGEIEVIQEVQLFDRRFLGI